MKLRLITLFNFEKSMAKVIKVIIFTSLAIGITHIKLNAELIKVAQSGYQFLKIDDPIKRKTALIPIIIKIESQT